MMRDHHRIGNVLHNNVLHYVTAREMYNLVRAAAAGKTGDPRQYMDWVIPPYESSRMPVNRPPLIQP